MNNSSPLALFVTWTVYGTFLPGDLRRWRHRKVGHQPARPALEQWHRDRLNHDVVFLDAAMQDVTELAIREICEYRNWQVWAINVRSNHVHVVLSAPAYRPTLVRDQLKSKATRELRLSFSVWLDRPVWTAKGDIEFLDTQHEVEQCTLYVTEAQDRKARDSAS